MCTLDGRTPPNVSSSTFEIGQLDLDGLHEVRNLERGLRGSFDCEAHFVRCEAHFVRCEAHFVRCEAHFVRCEAHFVR